MFGKGISQSGDILDLAANIDIVNKSGAWYQYNSEKIGQGRENAKMYLKQNPEVCEEIAAAIRDHYAESDENEVGLIGGEKDIPTEVID